MDDCMNKTTSKGAKQGHHGVAAHGQFSVYNTAASLYGDHLFE
jgi:hypothetical protein